MIQIHQRTGRWHSHAWRTTLLLLVLGTASCASNEPRPLRIAANPWPGFEYFYLAQELGFFREEGVEVRLVEQTSLRDSRRVYVRGLVDGLLATPTDVAALEIEGGRRAVVRQVFDGSYGGDVIIARDPFRTMQDLRGKRIAIEQGLGNYFLARALQISNMRPEDVEVVDRPYAAAAESLCDGTVDAIHAYPPTLEQLATMTDGQFHIVFTSKKLPDEILDLLVVDPIVATDRVEDLERLERAYDRAVLYTESEPDVAMRIMSDRESISPEAFANFLRNDMRMIRPQDRNAYLTADGPVALAIQRSHEILSKYRDVKHAVAGNAAVTPMNAP
jgi:NitT/TauT family transport system substrate-binding protein